MRRRAPTPARASKSAWTEPKAPNPTTAARAARMRRCPSSPRGAKRLCREYRESGRGIITSLFRMVAASPEQTCRENTALSLFYVRLVVLPLLILVCTIALPAQTPTDSPDASQRDANQQDTNQRDTNQGAALEGRTIVSIVRDPPSNAAPWFVSRWFVSCW